MDKTDYVQMFDLKPEEQSLHILICGKHKPPSGWSTVEFVSAEMLPQLSFADQSFDLVLCPHVLFVENQTLNEPFHEKTLLELSRVGTEVRIFPLVNPKGQPSNYLGLLLQALQEKGLGVELRQIHAQSDRPANAMLRVWGTVCMV